MNYKQILQKVSKEIDIPYDVVNKAYSSYWKFVRETITSLPLKEDLTKDEFLKLRTNFNVPSLGKLNCTYERMMGVKKRYKRTKEGNGRV